MLNEKKSSSLTRVLVLPPRPGSAARKRAGATVHPEGVVDGIAMLEEGVGQGQLIMHRAISEMQAVPEDAEVVGQGQLTISNSAPVTGSQPPAYVRPCWCGVG